MSQQSFQDERTYHHVMPLKVYLAVFFALVMLTGITVLVSYANLGKASLYTALVVALVKAGFVVGYFMHLKFDTKFHQLIFFGSLFFMSIFFVFTFIDMSSRSTIVPEQGNFALARDHATEAMIAARGKHAQDREALIAELKQGATPAQLAAGQKVYQARCLSCHGPTGKGNGVAAAAMDPKPRDYTDVQWQSRVDHQRIARVILRGGVGTGLATTMPPHPDLRDKIVGLVAYIRSFAGISMLRQVAPAVSAPAVSAPAVSAPQVSAGTGAATGALKAPKASQAAPALKPKPAAAPTAAAATPPSATR